MADDIAPQSYEYRVIPAPRKGEKAKGVRSGEARFALTMSRLFNRMGEQGWEYVRADTLPSEERVGLTGSEVRYHALLVFRRAVAVPAQIQPPEDPQSLPTNKAPLLLTAPLPEWQGFDEEEVEEAQVVSLLAARAKRNVAAE